MGKIELVEGERVIASRTYTGGLPYRERIKIVKERVFS